jgi:predicted dienelactone hydrolase
MQFGAGKSTLRRFPVATSTSRGKFFDAMAVPARNLVLSAALARCILSSAMRHILCFVWLAAVLRAQTPLSPVVPDHPTGKLEDDALKSFAWLRKDVFPTWTADASFTLDRIEELNRTPGQRFYRRLDLSRIAMLGWSFGGATSVQMSKDDRRVKAAIDQDGQLFGDVAAKGTTKPVMLMHHGLVDKTPNPADQPTLNMLMHQVDEENRSLLDHSTGDRYELTLAETQHGHFSDLLLANPPPGQMDPRRAHEIILAYTLAFFDKYLNGHDGSLLTATSSPYPEVTFRRLAAGTH